MEENKNIQAEKQKSTAKTILLICVIALIAFNLYIYFTGNYVSVQDLMNDVQVIHIPYRNILSGNKGYVAQLIAFLETEEQPDSLFYEKLLIVCIFAGCVCALIGIIRLQKNKFDFLIAGIVLACVGSGGLLLVIKVTELALDNAINSYGALGALFGDMIKKMLKIDTDSILHFIVNLIISLLAVYEINKLKNILKGETKDEHPIPEPQCNQ